ncbi:DUF4276 family protein [Paraburkholderia phenoliruptrix]|uniref:DUF4276 family protein n=2 Tax=Paraburkholderia phenoliruptrix TaxID=252970 RepID=K0DZI4_9BURK|nr:DUF4276 family protein [Paraburkholderia phenoliruptrix]AFT90270.1 hypothetical protein BUPH_05031 [Paraburkholderia phenoliruptrix BR3459a]CAB4051689.1 hypothetical protein LMG9964_05368 [Paraburkholderia phenoliruptrix]
MKKVAIFVEGDTEFYFVAKLVQEVAGYGNVRLILAKQHGNTIHFIKEAGAPADVAPLEIFLVNCCCGEKVKSAILESGQLLKNKGYTKVIGLQDLFPKTLEELEKFEAGLAVGLDKAPLPVKICVAVKEVEAWFLNEAAHFPKIDPKLGSETIAQAVGFNPEKDNAELTIKHPAVTLNKIYELAGLQYKKHGSQVHRLVAALDFDSLYHKVRETSLSLNKFLCELEQALHTEPEVAPAAA